MVIGSRVICSVKVKELVEEDGQARKDGLVALEQAVGWMVLFCWGMG